MKEIILASNNQNKLREIKEKLDAFGIQVLSQQEVGCNFEVEETGTTFMENAELKADAIHKVTSKPVIADDSGLEVDFLEGKPGVYSHRFAGENATDEDRIHKILELLDGVPEDKRTARFKCSICYIDEKNEKHFFTGIAEGKIGFEPKGSNGFGFDPIFIYEGKAFAELTSEEKGQVSHRGRAISLFVDYLNQKNFSNH
ncbi:MAG: RdgB/HAM1 family non-canonical purine NTP pyrophosphatase [Clostridia bacterium]|nr:RdgB/HAM1 family non-canonical purine NTP pyrophosphatase [Clostridia bacterium]